MGVSEALFVCDPLDVMFVSKVDRLLMKSEVCVLKFIIVGCDPSNVCF